MARLRTGERFEPRTGLPEQPGPGGRDPEVAVAVVPEILDGRAWLVAPPTAGITPEGPFAVNACPEAPVRIFVQELDDLATQLGLGGDATSLEDVQPGAGPDPEPPGAVLEQRKTVRWDSPESVP